MPSSTTKVGMAPLPCSIDTTLSWEQFLQAQQSPLRALGTHSWHLPSFILEKPPRAARSQRSWGPAVFPWVLSILVWFSLCCTGRSLPRASLDPAP